MKEIDRLIELQKCQARIEEFESWLGTYADAPPTMDVLKYQKDQAMMATFESWRASFSDLPSQQEARDLGSNLRRALEAGAEKGWPRDWPPDAITGLCDVYEEALKAAWKAAEAATAERCASIAWAHYMDTCSVRGISPARVDVARFCAAERIRKVFNRK